MNIWDVAAVLAGVLVVLMLVMGIFIIITIAVLGTGFAVSSRNAEKADAPDHPSRHLRAVK
jgi:heme/copper-type cytochrome/quinol oxidase subunit 2